MKKVTLAGLFCALVVTACGGSSPSSQSSSSPSESASASPTAAAAGGQVLETISVSENEFSLTPSTVKLSKPGTYDFKVVNTGTTVHALEIKGNGVDVKTGSLSAGSNADLKVTLPAGTFDMFCPVDGHKGLGMDGSITVTG